MSYFNQFQYSQSTASFDSSYTGENVEKGHKNQTQVDLTRFDEICKKFREHKDMKIKNLSGNDKDDFNLAVSYVNLLYGTDFYSKLFEKVRKNFDSVVTTTPGTVGAYFAGCLVASRNKAEDGEVPASCGLPCVDGMPLPQEEGWELCDKAVIMAERSGEGYQFSLVKPGQKQGDGEAYLFVEAKSEQDFTGFTQEEKDEILAYGCRKVHVVGYTSDMTYSDIYTESQTVEKLKSRRSRSGKRHHNHKKNNNWWWLLLAILFIFLVLVVAWSVNKYQ